MATSAPDLIATCPQTGRSIEIWLATQLAVADGTTFTGPVVLAAAQAMGRLPINSQARFDAGAQVLLGGEG